MSFCHFNAAPFCDGQVDHRNSAEPASGLHRQLRGESFQRFLSGAMQYNADVHISYLKSTFTNIRGDHRVLYDKREILNILILSLLTLQNDVKSPKSTRHSCQVTWSHSGKQDEIKTVQLVIETTPTEIDCDQRHKSNLGKFFLMKSKARVPARTNKALFYSLYVCSKSTMCTYFFRYWSYMDSQSTAEGCEVPEVPSDHASSDCLH